MLGINFVIPRGRLPEGAKERGEVMSVKWFLGVELDGFVEAMKAIRKEMLEDPEVLRSAPHTLPVRRLDDVKAARELNLAWSPS